MSDEQQDAAFWISYSDLAVGVLTVFVLITTALLLDTETRSQAAKVAENEARVAKAQAQSFKQELTRKKSEIEALVGVRQSLIKELSRQFAKQGQQVKVDPKTGALQLPSDIIFDQGSADLSRKGQTWLKNFVPQYFSVLLSPQFSKHIRRIEVEGHASSEGPEFGNLELSQSRALTVTKYILKNHGRTLAPKQQKILKQVLVASGRGEYDLVFNEKGEDKEESRRVVFKFRLTEEQTLKDIQEMLGDSQ